MNNKSKVVRGSLNKGQLITSPIYEQKFAWIIPPFENPFGCRKVGGCFGTCSNYIKSDCFIFSPVENFEFYLDLIHVKEIRFAVDLHKKPLNNEIISEENVSAAYTAISVIHRGRYFEPSEDLTLGFLDFDYDSRYELIVLCRFSLPKQSNEEQLMKSSAAAASDHMTKNILSLLNNEKLFDITISVEGTEFRAHRIILSARSPVFAAMFEHDTQEKRDSRIDITDFSSEIVSQLLFYIYGGQLDLNEEKALCLYRAADKYDIPQLKEQCSRYLCTNMTVHGVLSVLVLIQQIQDKLLEKMATEFFAKNAVVVMQQKEWLPFMKSYPELANLVLIHAFTQEECIKEESFCSYSEDFKKLQCQKVFDV